MMRDEASVVAVDPGSAKCGLAVVTREGRVLFRAIVTPDTLVEETRCLVAAYHPVCLLVGNGTGSKPLLRGLQEAGLSVEIRPVDESHTSELARARFVAENRPRGLQWLLPRSLRTPWRPYDDYVAVLLAERYWQSNDGV